MISFILLLIHYPFWFNILFTLQKHLTLIRYHHLVFPNQHDTPIVSIRNNTYFNNVAFCSSYFINFNLQCVSKSKCCLQCLQTSVEQVTSLFAHNISNVLVCTMLKCVFHDYIHNYICNCICISDYMIN